MSNKTDKILNGDYSFFPSTSEAFPSEFLEVEDKFVERLGSVIKDSYNPKGALSYEVPGIVLKIKKDGKVTPGGPRDRVNVISSKPAETCLKMWVHTKFDNSLAVPKNFIEPGAEVGLIYEHFIYEAQNEETDKVIPGVGDIVQVVHPWAWGWTNKVGVYVGKLAPGDAPKYKSAKDAYKKNNQRVKSID